MKNDPGHVLYRTPDPDRPGAICDANGEVVLGLCKWCGAAEVQLVAPCARIADDSSAFPFIALARRLGAPYGAVLAIADAITRGAAGRELYRSDDALTMAAFGHPEDWALQVADLVTWEKRRRAAVRHGIEFSEPVPT